MLLIALTSTEVAGAAPGLHIPDGFLSTPISIAGWIVTIAVVALSSRMANRSLNERAVPLMGVMAAFIFAAQMMNFPVAGGTSGHMLGGALAAILLGPWAAVIVMSAVVGLQAFLFQDGGIAVLGVNIFNMGILTAFLGHGVYRAVQSVAARRHTVALVAAFAAAWVTVEGAAVITAFQLALSDTSPLDVALPAMVGVHALIGIGEGLITAAALGFIMSTRADLLPDHTREAATARAGA
jgi:cobalt/nickel transport system permease protein